MEFRTVIKPEPRQGMISHATRMVILGSCFADNIGKRLEAGLFNVCVNPFGTIYNAASIATLLERIASGEPFSGNELIRNGAVYSSWLSHSSLSSVSAGKTLSNLNNALRLSRQALHEADLIIITLGTSYVFSLADSPDTIVANCHKFPAASFVRSRLCTASTADWIERSIAAVKRMSPRAKIMFTVSPIRHTADGLHGNQLSKAILLLAIDEICRRHPEDCLYFPAYEALLDDLRDYRFYEADMKHPSKTAVDYIYALFSSAYFSPETIQLEKQALAITKRKAHRPLTDDIDSLTNFRITTENMASALLNTHPELLEAYSRFNEKLES